MTKAIVSGLVLMNILGFIGCSSTPVNPNDPVALLADAEDDIKSEHYLIALEKLRSIKNKFPYSGQSILAHLRIGDVYFLQESFAEAAAVYESFRDLHPSHPKTPFAVFRVGKSYYNDLPGTIARDLTTATQALDAFTRFVHRYPDSPDVAEARKDMKDLRERLADKELYIGEFYFIRDFYDSAKPRYQKVLDLYPETPAAKKARMRLAKIATKSAGGAQPRGESDETKDTRDAKPKS